MTDPWTEDPATGCWLWDGYVTRAGYAQTGRNTLVHRAVYKEMHGPIPPGHEVHHTCSTKRCIRPSHLKLVTRSEHWEAEQELQGVDFRWKNRERPERCPHDHEPDWVYYPSRPTRRVCRECVRIRNQARFVPKCVAWQGTDGPSP